MTKESAQPAVLVVDDEPRILDSIQALLEGRFVVFTSTDTDVALRVLQSSKVSVILADQRMPGLTGDQFLALASKLSDATRILLTGYADIDGLIRAVNHGHVHTFVTKPWDPGQLRQTIDEAVGHAQQLRRQKDALETVAKQQEALKASEAALRRQTKVLQSILGSMAEGVVVVDKDEKVLVVNPSAETIFGRGALELPQHEWSKHFGIYDPVTAALCPTDALPVVRGIRGEILDDMELLVKNQANPDGMFVSVSVRPLKDDAGDTNGAVAVLRNITGAKRTAELLRSAKEEAERANLAKSEFLSRMSHELRTPLNSILGFGQVLLLGRMEDRQREGVEHILKGGKHLLDLVNEVLDIARIEAGHLALSLEPVKVLPAIQQALDLIRPLAVERDVRIIEPDGKFRPLVHADPQRLSQVLLNIISNAVKYNRPGGTVTVACEPAAAGRLRIVVTDTGLGIASSNLDKLFAPFERLEAERSQVQGTGLGLALSKRLVEAMEGVIGVQSTVGVGSTFMLEFEMLARTVRDEDGGAVESIQGGGVEGDAIAGTIVYIEDNVSNLRLMESILLNRSSVRLLSAMQGQLGYELCQAQRPDLILLDLHLPDMGGEQVLQLLRADPKTSSIPVVMVSADATPKQMDHLLKAGAHGYITKPLAVRELLELIDKILDGRRSG